MARAARGAAKTSVRVNFKDVESRKTPTEGDYILEILEANSTKSGAGNDQIEFVLEVAKGEYKGTKLWFYCPLDEKSLWKLHAFLTALGEDVPQDNFDIDLPELIGKQVVGVLTHETYQGRKRAKMTDFDSVKNYTGKDNDDDKSSKKDKKGKKDKDGKKAKDEPEEKAKDKKADKGKDAKADKKGDAKKDKDDGKKSKKDKVPKIDADDVKALDEKGLKKFIKEHKLDVDLDDYPKLKKQIAAVIDALEAKDMLAD